MEALFIVPCMVSPNINERLVPALAKMVERNILLNNSGLFQQAAVKKYSSQKGIIKKMLRMESANLTESDNIDDVPIYMMSEYNIDEGVTKFDPINHLFEEYQMHKNLSLIMESASGSTYLHTHKELLKDLDLEDAFIHVATLQRHTLNNLYGGKNLDPEEYSKNQKQLTDLYKMEAQLMTLVNNYAKQNYEQYDLNPKKLDNEGKRLEQDAEKLNLSRSDSLFNQEKFKREYDLNVRKLDRNDFDSEREYNLALQKAGLDAIKNNFDRQKFEREYALNLRKLGHEERMSVRRDAREAAKSKRELKALDLEIKSLKQQHKAVGKATLAHDMYKPKMTYSKMDEIQDPGGVTFFRQISIEPTFMDIPISVKRSAEKGDNYYMEIRVGVKCIPYFVDDVTNIVFLMREAKFMGTIERLFKNAVRSINKRVWFTKARSINKGGYVDPREAVNTIKYTPSRKEMENTRRVSKMFSTNKSPNWTTMIALSSFDLTDKELSDFIRNYKRMTEYVIGDIIIVNETKESAYFCTVRMNSCQELSFAYLRKILNMENVLDYNAVARQANPWKSEARPRKSRLSRVFGR